MRRPQPRLARATHPHDALTPGGDHPEGRFTTHAAISIHRGMNRCNRFGSWLACVAVAILLSACGAETPIAVERTMSVSQAVSNRGDVFPIPSNIEDFRDVTSAFIPVELEAADGPRLAPPTPPAASDCLSAPSASPAAATAPLPCSRRWRTTLGSWRRVAGGGVRLDLDPRLARGGSSRAATATARRSPG